MDPGRKRAIRLTIALTVALLLASALVYTSFSAGRDELTASQLLKDARPGKSYILAGTVLDGSVKHEGEDLLFRVRDPKLRVSVPVIYSGIVPDPKRIITGGHENKTARTVAIYQDEAINEAALATMFRQIIANNRAGGRRKLKTRRANR